MARPLLICTDEGTLARDLRHAFGDRVSVVSARSEAETTEILEDALRRERDVALVISHDEGLLHEVRARSPRTRRMLLSECATTDDATVHRVIPPPWEPAERRLFPAVGEELDASDSPDAEASPWEGTVVYGHRWSPESHAIRDFLSRQRADYRWVDVERDPPAWIGSRTLPIVELPDGDRLENPSFEAIVERVGGSLGFVEQPQAKTYDLVVIGGGPAGLAGSVYGASEGLATLLVERDVPGGQAGAASLIENYLGFPHGVTGADLARRAREQAIRFGVEILSLRAAVGLRAERDYRIVTLADGTEVATRSVLLATGVQWRRLDVPGEAEMLNRGVYYGASYTEESSCRDEGVLVVGGANSAGQAAVNLSAYAGRVTMLVREDELAVSMSAYLCDRITASDRIEVRTCSSVRAFCGSEHLEAVEIDGPNGPERIEATGAFVFIGAEPETDWLGDVVARDDGGFVLTGPDLPKGAWSRRSRPPMLLETSMPGVFCAGDVRAGAVRRVASSVGQGSIAVQFVHEWLREIGA